MRSIQPLTVVLALVAAPACAPAPEAGPDDPEVAPINYGITDFKDLGTACTHAALEAELATLMAEDDLVGCAVAIGDGEELLYTTAAGSAEVDANGVQVRPYTAKLPSGVGSISKTITAVALMSLWEDGYLGAGTLDEITLRDMMEPEFGLVLPALHQRDWVLDLTLEELLSHQSGIYDVDGTWLARTGPATTEDVWTATSVDWANPDLGLTAEELALKQPGAHPRVSIKAAIPPLFPDYDSSVISRYANMNYAWLAAVIDAVVSQPDFDGYGAKGPYLEHGYETWAWFVWTGGAQDFDNGLLTMALNHSWRETQEAIPGMPDSYFSSTNPAGDWGYYGWEVGSGGWTMTTSDLVRLATADHQGLFIDNWADIRTVRSTVQDISPYGLGYQQITIVDDGNHYLYGHGGSIRGYSAGAFRVKPSGEPILMVGWECNTAPLKADGTKKAIHKWVTHRLQEAWYSGKLDCSPAYEPSAGSAGEVVKERYLDTWMAEAETALAKGKVADALELADRYLTSPEGIIGLEALLEGELETAAECALVLEGDTSGRWTCE